MASLYELIYLFVLLESIQISIDGASSEKHQLKLRSLLLAQLLLKEIEQTD